MSGAETVGIELAGLAISLLTLLAVNAITGQRGPRSGPEGLMTFIGCIGFGYGIAVTRWFAIWWMGPDEDLATTLQGLGGEIAALTATAFAGMLVGHAAGMG